MPSKKKKYNARFPAGRIKKIMQTDEEVGKVAQAVPIIISRTLELFVESLLTKSMQITQSRNAKTLTPSHMKQCILSESRFDFLKDLVKNIPDATVQDDHDNDEANLLDSSFENKNAKPSGSSRSHNTEPSEQSTSRKIPVIRYAPQVNYAETVQNSTAGNNTSATDSDEEECSNIQFTVPALSTENNVPSLIPFSNNFYSQNTSENLLIDEDYDN